MFQHHHCIATLSVCYQLMNSVLAQKVVAAAELCGARTQKTGDGGGRALVASCCAALILLGRPAGPPGCWPARLHEKCSGRGPHSAARRVCTNRHRVWRPGG